MIGVVMLGLSNDSAVLFTNPNSPAGSSLVSMVTVTVVGDPNLAPPVTESNATANNSRCSGMASLIISTLMDEEFWPVVNRMVPLSREKSSPK